MNTIKTLSIDIETYSDKDLNKCGVYKYAESDQAELLLFGYSINQEEVKVIDIASGEEMPSFLLEALVDESVTKWAFNASFERVFLSVWLKRNYPELSFTLLLALQYGLERIFGTSFIIKGSRSSTEA